MTRTGQCTCGQVTLSIEGEPSATRQCWCRQCRRIATGGPTHNAMFVENQVSLTGALSTADYTSASGSTVTHHFCPQCGTQVMGTNSARPKFRVIRFGVIEEPHGLSPQMAIWISEAPDWAVIDPGLEQHERQPPPPAGSN